MTSIARVDSLWVATERHGELLRLPAVQLKAGAGIVGDRFFSRSRRHPGRNLTLVEAEAIAAAAATLGITLAPEATRRNVVTRDIRLNDLVGKTFRVGAVQLRGIELCEPCIVLGRHLAGTRATPAQVIAAFLGRGGLRAAVLEDGVIRDGDAITPLSTAPRAGGHPLI